MSKVAKENLAYARPSEEFEANSVGRIVTSFNALTDVKMDLGDVVGKPGLHVFPDLPYLLRVGLARKDGDEYVSKDHTGAERWRDCDPGMGSPFTDGYRCVIWFPPTQISFTITGSTYTTPLRSHGKRIIDASDLAMVAEEISYKYDGDHYKLVFTSGEGRLTAEEGRALTLWGADETPEMDVDLERVGDGFVVTKVSRFAPFWPHHTLDTCEKFCQAVSLSIDGEPIKLYPPERFQRERCLDLLARKEIDGLVMKRNNADHLIKAEQTIDVPDSVPLEAYVTAAQDAGYTLVFPAPYFGQDRDTNVTEYTLQRHGPDITGVFKKRRYKTRWDDPAAMVRFLTWPTMFTYLDEKAHLDRF
jgi:hypothetical protein